MKLAPVSHVPYSQRVGSYRVQMLQAALRGQVHPIDSYSLQPFYERHKQWVTDTSNALAAELAPGLREETNGLRNASLSSFSRFAQAKQRQNRYAACTLPGMFYHFAVNTGLILNRVM